MIRCESLFRGRQCPRWADKIVRVRSYKGSGTTSLLCLCGMHARNVVAGMIVVVSEKVLTSVDGVAEHHADPPC